ncbi:MAG: LLM class flavin-dependent oxidoreductase [SAR324 cluster bacterium]|nr:LLM class flavin-dependent oxidoreductase [SAR324 cluster bacterium]
MKFGIYISFQHTMQDDIVRKTEEHFEQVRVMRECGFDSLWAGQHWVPHPFKMLQPVPFLARAMAEAGDMIIGTNLLLVPFYQPLHVAEIATTMDIMSGGRFRLGVGLGYRDVEFENLGVPKKERVGRLVETIEILRLLWSQERVTYQGKYYRLKDTGLTSRPIQSPHPPILIGANLPAAVRRAGRIADGWLASGNVTLEALLQLQQEFERGRAEGGRPEPSERYLFIDIFLSEDRNRVLEEVAPNIKAKYDAFVLWGNVKMESLEVPPEQLARERLIVGDPGQCIARLREYHARGGFNHVIARVQLPGPEHSLEQEKVLRSIRLLGTEVAPALRNLA